MSNKYPQRLSLGMLTQIACSGKEEKHKYVIYQMTNKRFVAECFPPEGSRHAFFDTSADARQYIQDFKQEMEAL